MRTFPNLLAMVDYFLPTNLLIEGQLRVPLDFLPSSGCQKIRHHFSSTTIAYCRTGLKQTRIGQDFLFFRKHCCKTFFPIPLSPSHRSPTQPFPLSPCINSLSILFITCCGQQIKPRCQMSVCGKEQISLYQCRTGENWPTLWLTPSHVWRGCY